MINPVPNHPVEPLRIFIGTEPSQVVAHQVLAHSIRVNASIPVEITPMLDLDIPVPVDVENRARVGFSFTRFAIPELCGYHGRALYLDADMLVFGDVAELAGLAFEGRRLLCTSQPEPPAAWADKASFRPGRHSAVMLLDTSLLPWKPADIIAGLDAGRYTYDQLVHDQCLVAPDDIADTIPVEWNSLERYEPGKTRLVHYTVVHTQPWKSGHNPLGHLWLKAFADAVQAGAVAPADVETAVAAGHIRRNLLDVLELAPGRPAPSAAEAARDLVLARIRIAELEAERRMTESSRTWRVAQGLQRGAELVRTSADRFARPKPRP